MTSQTYERQRPAASAPVAAPLTEQMSADNCAPAPQSIGTSQQRASVTQRSQRLKEEIDRLKSCIPPIPPTISLGAPISSGELAHVPQAPLASLDFSISTEPTSLLIATNTSTSENISTTPTAAAYDKKKEQQQQQRQKQQDVSSSSVDTPSLSGFLDCDELSDMIDDSLFEITNAGCLSRSVFPRDSRLVVDRTTSGLLQPEAVAVGQDSGGERTPTNEGAPAGPTPRAPQQMQGRPLIYSARHSAPARPSQVSAIMAHVQSHDYSSTTSVPRQIRSSLTIASGSRDAARLMTSANQQPDSSAPSARRRHSAGRRASGKQCAACVAERKGVKSKPIKEAKKRGFTSSLFSLFSSGANNHQDQDQKHEDDLKAMGQQHTCHLQGQRADEEALPMLRSGGGGGGGGGCREPANGSLSATNQAQQRPARPALGPNNANSRAPLPALRLRDSIKITNQRKLRNSAGANRDKKHQRESNKTGSSGDEEVLLDLSRAGARSKTNNRQSSSDGAPPSQALVARSSDSSMISANSSASNSIRPLAAGSGSSSSGRQNKCVKFTTPDRVMILSGAGQTARRNCSAGEKPRKAAQSSSYSNLAGAAGQQHQPTPIIKRPGGGGGGAAVAVPKSSSYSQTEPNEGLDELLARYERDNHLVTAINEKLRLTETIASNLSALDRVDINTDELTEGSQTATAQNELIATTTTTNTHEREQDNEPSSGVVSCAEAPALEPTLAEELSISEADLARRPVQIMEASGVFGWRAEDELALAPVVGPGASDDEDDSEDELTRRRRAHEELLEREAAARCECNQRLVNEAAANSPPTIDANRIIPRAEHDQISDLGHLNGPLGTQAPSVRPSDKISSSLASSSSGRLASGERSSSSSTTPGSQEAGDTAAPDYRPFARQSPAPPQLEQRDRHRALYSMAPS